MNLYIYLAPFLLIIIQLGLIVFVLKKTLQNNFASANEKNIKFFDNTQHILKDLLSEKVMQMQLNTQQYVTDAVGKHMQDVRSQLSHSFKQHADALGTNFNSLTSEIRNHLHNLTSEVNNRLSQGFEKTSSTFADVVRRLAIIDEAQKKITELSNNVVSLQDVLVDKKSRGAFGEVQLSNLITNMIPKSNYAMQYTLSNQKRADCILFLPNPTGNVVIDAKFPLETYQKIFNTKDVNEKNLLQTQFRKDLQRHIKDISEKYIIPGETAEGAMMFIPAEAIFAEIHANYPDIIQAAQRSKVWIVSPSTLMAVLTTALAVLKDDATRKQVHIIQKHLHALADDFQRFEKRMDNLARHIDLAQKDAQDVKTSAKKITQKFTKIESVELEHLPEKLEQITEEC